MYSLQFSVILSTSYDTITTLSQKCNLAFKFERLLINVPIYRTSDSISVFDFGRKKFINLRWCACLIY